MSNRFEEPVIEAIRPKQREAREITILEPIPELKLEKRLEELKIIHERNLCLGLSFVPHIAGSVLLLFSTWLYVTTPEKIQLIPEWLSPLASYNLGAWISIFWLAVGLGLGGYSLCREPSFPRASFILGALLLFTGLSFAGLGIYLYFIIELYAGVLAPYNILLPLGLISIAVSLVILYLNRRFKLKK